MLIAEGLADLLEFLIQCLHDKTNMNIGDDIGSTAAHDAAEFGEHDALLVLLKHGADISIKNQVIFISICLIFSINTIEW